jgi:hypothetical protein
MTNNYREQMIENFKKNNKNLQYLSENEDRIDYFIYELTKYFKYNKYSSSIRKHNYMIASLFNDLFLNEYKMSTIMGKFSRENTWNKYDENDCIVNIITDDDIRIFVQYILNDKLDKKRITLMRVMEEQNQNSIDDMKIQVDSLDDLIRYFSDGTIYNEMAVTLLQFKNK